MATSYTEFVNSHILLLAGAAVSLLMLLRISEGVGRGWYGLIAATGFVGGFCYATDLGAGPPLLVAVIACIWWRRGLAAALVAAIAAFPWIALHHAINYRIAGEFLPANMTASFLQWPGSSMASVMTGTVPHRGLHRTFGYLVQLMFGRRGLLNHNLPLF